MKQLAVWLSVMVCFFGSWQLYAAMPKVNPKVVREAANATVNVAKALHAGRSIAPLWNRFARDHEVIASGVRFIGEHKWWVILFIGVFGVAVYIDDKKMKKEKGKKRLEDDHDEKGTT